MTPSGREKNHHYMWTVTISRPIYLVKWQFEIFQKCLYMQTVTVPGLNCKSKGLLNHQTSSAKYISTTPILV